MAKAKKRISARTTRDRVDGELEASEDAKTAPRGYHQLKENRGVPHIRNASGMPAFISCPGHTDFCKAHCYAADAEVQPGVDENVQRNYEILMAQATPADVAAKYDRMLDRFMEEAEMIGLTREERIFRHGWDGDVPTEVVAEGLAMSIERHQDMDHWIYTRTYTTEVNVLPILVGVPGLVLYMSVDHYNYNRAREVEVDFPDVPWAACATDYTGCRQLLAHRASRHRALICPENEGRMRLMNPDRKDPSVMVGACVQCRVCIHGHMDVMFSTSHREDSAIPMPNGRRSGYTYEPLFERPFEVPVMVGRTRQRRPVLPPPDSEQPMLPLIEDL